MRNRLDIQSSKNIVRKIIKIVLVLFVLRVAAINVLLTFSLDEVQLFSSSVVPLLSYLAGIAFLVLVLWDKAPSEDSGEPDSPQQNLQYSWRAFFFGILLCVGVILIVNPRGLYGIKLFPQLSNAIKQEKVKYYNRLELDPEVVILGSSRALTLSPDYIQELVGYETYNFSISGVTQDELALQGQMLSSGRVRSIPHVVLFEISPSNLQPLNGVNLADVPIEFLPYMSGKQGLTFVLDRFEKLFSGYQFSEALYVLQFLRQERMPQNYWEVHPDGSSDFFPKETLDQALARQLQERRSQHQTPCQNYAKGADRMIRDFVSLAEQNQFSIVFYFSPIHPYFQQEYLDKSEDYGWCLEIFSELMTSLSDEFPNIFYVDLSDPAAAGLRTDDLGFYDGFHITPASAQLVAEALAPEIRSAYTAADQMRTSQP